MNILLTNSNSYKAVVIAKFLKKHYDSVKIFGISKKKSLNIYSKYFDSVFVGSPKEDVVKQHNIDLIIPIDSKTISDWLNVKHELNHTLDYVSDNHIFELLNNKESFTSLCSELNIAIPGTYTKNQINLLEDHRIYVFKPVKSAASKGVKYFKQLDELRQYCRLFHGEFIIQEYFKGCGGGISFFAVNGKIFNHYIHTRIAEYPVSGGSSTIRGRFEAVFEQEIIQAAQKLIAYVQWSGFCMLEFKYNEERFVFIEANPRIWGSIYQGLASGNNYFEQLLGKSAKKLLFDPNVITYQSPLVFLSLLGYFFKGNFKKFISIFGLFKAKADISFFDDPKGYLGQFFV
jgi:predicted ATP-grasp superfamily ATP-dependent carboligase